jgi:hypothetical protein
MDFIDVSVQVARWKVGVEDFTSLVCGRCQAPLAFHQPEPRTPQRILATCEECDAWYLLDASGGWMLLLPEGELRNPSRPCLTRSESEIATP